LYFPFSCVFFSFFVFFFFFLFFFLFVLALGYGIL